MVGKTRFSAPLKMGTKSTLGNQNTLTHSQLGQDSALILSKETLSITQDTDGMGEGNLQGACTLQKMLTLRGV